ncbi:hypothetical protein PIGHUM_04653 [Pigmentiphaga humi]|uniref:DUF4136 domain-containing protein n=1 Tax=Pigmentiphaga humi TaxID=2478468 RepID=A0A3P4B9A3_9BURK|nr:DUF4136 domain-containing protein [Pigmentiphaga humi]VCU72551.1 hypothetical protein PIGHUM_04653 [Pigmentiphaga humi]
MSISKCNVLFRSGAWLWTSRAAKLAAVALLAGCATTVPARVTTFQKWPADAAGATWRFDPSTVQRDSLEYGEYADMIRAAMGPIGLVEAQRGQAARFTVNFSYGVEPVKVRVERPAYDPFYGPWGPWGFGGFGYRGRGGMGFGWSAPYPSTWTATTVDASRASLKVEIRDASRNNQKVYESTAVSHGAGDSVPETMPYLVRAIFDRFPDTNGQVRDVSYEVQRQQ